MNLLFVNTLLMIIYQYKKTVIKYITATVNKNGKKPSKKEKGTKACAVAPFPFTPYEKLIHPLQIYQILLRESSNPFGRTIVNTREILKPKWIPPFVQSLVD